MILSDGFGNRHDSRLKAHEVMKMILTFDFGGTYFGNCYDHIYDGWLDGNFIGSL